MREREVFLKITADYNNKTLSEYFLGYRISKAYINNLFNTKKIILNGGAVNAGNVKVFQGDMVQIKLPVDNIIPFKFNVKIIYEDEWIIVINKPSNILVHSDGQTSETLTNAVNYYLNKNNDICDAYPVHRLDYETTGIVIFAKNKLALAFLSVAIEEHELVKEYVCLCHGKFSKMKDVLSFPIGKDRHSNKQIVVKTGKEAKSYYEVVENNNISKVKVKIEHGRKHQIRVHLAHINHPILGDKLYGNDHVDGLKLHFKKVVFIHPYTREELVFVCKEDF